jgi:hypothetical protein
MLMLLEEQYFHLLMYGGLEVTHMKIEQLDLSTIQQRLIMNNFQK